MKNLLIISLLLITSNVFGQIKITGPITEKVKITKDTIYYLLVCDSTETNSSGQFNGITQRAKLIKIDSAFRYGIYIKPDSSYKTNNWSIYEY